MTGPSPLRELRRLSFEPGAWVRYEYDGAPIYVHPQTPDWFVPNTAGDRAIGRLDGKANGAPMDFATRRFLERLPGHDDRPYPGRAACLDTTHLRELWFHVTNRCNLACRHCLFASSPNDAAELPAERILDLARQGADLGCRVFALTGGEPFVHGEFPRIVEGLLELDEAHVALLTNGMSLEEFKDRWRRWPEERLHLQISLDGLRANHDDLRGSGRFETLRRNLAVLRDAGRPFTLSMCVTQENMAQMPDVVEFAGDTGAGNVHFMWYFIRGRGTSDRYALPERIAPHLRQAVTRAEQLGIGIDNVDALRSQVFAPVGTRHDGTNAAWESVAVGPDNSLYPTPATIGLPQLATPLDDDLAAAWRGSDVLEDIRRATAATLDDPLRFLLGGGDLDHSIAHSGQVVGGDPYDPLHRSMALWLIAREAADQPDAGPPALRLKMGEALESCGAHGSVALAHTNCLVGTASKGSRAVVKTFYAQAARQPRKDILNPASYPEDLMTHIPAAYRFRGYGCGSPILDAALTEGDVMVDLGAGTGLECFVAAPQLGRRGRAIGIDMLDPMLDRAREGAAGVADTLGYNNLEFRKGYLEALPLPGDSADVVVSNCVLNLSSNKRKTFREIVRVLRPGGRLVVSDVVCDDPPDAAIRNDETLHGECIAGALTQTDLFRLLEEAGLTNLRVVRRVPYRVVQGHPFFSLTFSAARPARPTTRRVLYRGPFRGVVLSEGDILPAGEVREVAMDSEEGLDGQILLLDERGAPLNAPAEAACGCNGAPEGNAASTACCTPEPDEKHRSGCMVCGGPLRYLDAPAPMRCHYCGIEENAQGQCESGHYVCDACHADDALNVIRHICTTTRETDMFSLLATIRSHDSIPIHGPEHHALVPGIVTAVYRNTTGQIGREPIERAIDRGTQMPGGACAFMGICGAAVGVGIGFSVLLEATPYKGDSRQRVQQAVAEALGEIASFEAPRCCQRDCWLALRKAAEISERFLGVRLKANVPTSCAQHSLNEECVGGACPLWASPADEKIRSEGRRGNRKDAIQAIARSSG